MSKGVTARIDKTWKKFRVLCRVLINKQGLSLNQHGKIYQLLVRLVLSYCSETWGLTVANRLRLSGVEQCMIKSMCGGKTS